LSLAATSPALLTSWVKLESSGFAWSCLRTLNAGASSDLQPLSKRQSRITGDMVYLRLLVSIAKRTLWFKEPSTGLLARLAPGLKGGLVNKTWSCPGWVCVLPSPSGLPSSSRLLQCSYYILAVALAWRAAAPCSSPRTRCPWCLCASMVSCTVGGGVGGGGVGGGVGGVGGGGVGALRFDSHAALVLFHCHTACPPRSAGMPGVSAPSDDSPSQTLSQTALLQP
jgi:hypothetical protein